MASQMKSALKQIFGVTSCVWPPFRYNDLSAIKIAPKKWYRVRADATSTWNQTLKPHTHAHTDKTRIRVFTFDKRWCCEWTTLAKPHPIDSDRMTSETENDQWMAPVRWRHPTARRKRPQQKRINTASLDTSGCFTVTSRFCVIKSRSVWWTPCWRLKPRGRVSRNAATGAPRCLPYALFISNENW